MDESQFSGISFAVDSEFGSEASLSCFLGAAAWKACSLSIHVPYGIVLHFVQLGRGESMEYENLTLESNVAKKVGAK